MWCGVRTVSTFARQYTLAFSFHAYFELEGKQKRVTTQLEFHKCKVKNKKKKQAVGVN